MSGIAKVVSVESVKSKILFVRGKKVLLDADLAELYQVPTKRLNEQVKRNRKRFPLDFMFQLTEGELNRLQGRIVLRSHFATSKKGGRRYLPYVFTEQGVAMLSSVLNSDRAIQINIAIMRAFVKLRQVLAAHKELANRLTKLEKRMDKKDQEIMAVFEAIRKLISPPPEPPKKRIGFHVND